MGYMHIDSLYKCPQFFELFAKVYALEKIHGTSAWIFYDAKTSTLKLHPGGEKIEHFKVLFDEEFLKTKLANICLINQWDLIKVHGEAYGGKQQKMFNTYGPNLKFIVFDVYFESKGQTGFIDVPEAENIAMSLSLDFVHYYLIDNKPEIIEMESNKKSVQAIRNGMGSDKNREGVVVKPIVESTMPNGKRAIFKHKNAEFWEIQTRRPLGEKLKVVSEIDQIVLDWVTKQRYEHVKDRVLQQKETKNLEKGDIRTFLNLMVEDVKRESEGEVIWTDNLERSIRQKTALMFKSENAEFFIKV